MSDKEIIKRRTFIAKTGKAGAALGLSSLAFFERTLDAMPGMKPEINIFSKHLQWLNYAEMARTAAAMGFDGVDLTVRSKGHVEPARVKMDLPRAVEAIRHAGIKVTMITTAIQKASDPLTEFILRLAGQLKIKYYRMGWYKYDQGKSILTNMQEFQKEMEQLAVLNKTCGIHGAYQNHSGMSLGSPVWDLGIILDEINSEWLGVQYDIRHAMVEGAKSWPLGLQFLAKHINTLDIKDFTWQNGQLINVPLGEGMVDWAAYFDLLRKSQIRAPMSLHYEYDLGGAEHGKRNTTMKSEAVLNLMKKDLNFLKKTIAKAKY